MLFTSAFYQAAQDLRRFRGATNKNERELYLDAYRWLTVDERFWPFSFLNVCQLLNLAQDNVHQELIGDVSVSAFSYWMRRCRCGCRLRTSFSQLFVSERNASASRLISYVEAREMVLHNPASIGGACLHENVN